MSTMEVRQAIEQLYPNLESVKPSACSRALEIAAAYGTAQDVVWVQGQISQACYTGTAFAIGIARGCTDIAMLLKSGNSGLKKPMSEDDYCDFVVCGGTIALSDYDGHPRYPQDFFDIKTDGSNCDTILHLANFATFEFDTLTGLVSACLYQVNFYGDQLHRNESYYRKRGNSPNESAEVLSWKSLENSYFNCAQQLLKLTGKWIDAKRLLKERIGAMKYPKVTQMLCPMFPELVSDAFEPYLREYDAQPQDARKLENLSAVFPYLKPESVHNIQRLLDCLAINGMTNELQIASTWPNAIDLDTASHCMQLASANNQASAAAFLLDLKLKLMGGQVAASEANGLEL